eukprot:scaffold189_cov249-Pinguiococcus_pyrenoidosus.AAC.2
MGVSPAEQLRSFHWTPGSAAMTTGAKSSSSLPKPRSFLAVSSNVAAWTRLSSPSGSATRSAIGGGETAQLGHFLCDGQNQKFRATSSPLLPERVIVPRVSWASGEYVELLDNALRNAIAEARPWTASHGSMLTAWDAVAESCVSLLYSVLLPDTKASVGNEQMEENL